YGRRVTDFADGRESESGFLFPFYRWDETEEEKVYKSAPSLFPYSHSEPLDRNWAPVWSVWTEERDRSTGEVKARVLGPVWQYDRSWLGVTRRELDLGIFSVESWEGEHRPKERHVRFLWGLVSHDQLGDSGGWRLLGN